MSVKIRLARHGKKGFAYFHIVVADSHAPRDGRFIERIGTYDPNANPATIDIDGEKALDWLAKGAQPTDTCRRILSYKGVLLKKHLLEGVKKGALTEETANAKWEAWMQEKEGKVQTKRSELAQSSRNAVKARLEAEVKTKEAKAAIVAQKKSEQALKDAEAKAAQEAAEAVTDTVAEPETPPVETPTVEVPPVETPPVEAPSVEASPVEVPPIEAPSVEAPSVEASPVEVPPIEAPSVEASPVETPTVETPTIETSPVEVPPVEASPVETPPTETPSVETPPTEATATE